MLFVPEPARTSTSVHPGAANRYVGRLAEVPVTVVLREGDGSPMANERYTANAGAAVVHGTTDSEGRASLSVPVTTSEVTLSLDARAVGSTSW